MSNKRKGYTKHIYVDDEEVHRLVELAKSGDRRSIDILFRKYKPIMYSLAKKRYSKYSPQDIEDEVLLFLGRIFSRDILLFDVDKSKFSTWITFCFGNHLISISRRKKRIPQTYIDDIHKEDDRPFDIEDLSQSSSNFSEKIPFIKIARILISILGVVDTRLIILRHWYGESAKNCEKAVGYPRGSYKYYERKAFKKINQTLEKEDFLN